jgi:hypothetical protein
MEFQVSPVFLSLGCLKGKLSFLYEMLTHHPPTSNLDPLCTVNIVAKVAFYLEAPHGVPALITGQAFGGLSGLLVGAPTYLTLAFPHAHFSPRLGSDFL